MTITFDYILKIMIRIVVKIKFSLHFLIELFLEQNWQWKGTQ